MSNDKWFDEHYKALSSEQPSEQPPKFADEAILTAANKSNLQKQPASTRYGWWATAAVVVLSLSIFINLPEKSELSAPTESMINSSKEKSVVDTVIEAEVFEDDIVNNSAVKREQKQRALASQNTTSGMSQPAPGVTPEPAKPIDLLKEEVVVTATQKPSSEAIVADQEAAPLEDKQDRGRIEEARIVTGAHTQSARLEQRKNSASPHRMGYTVMRDCETYSSTKDEITVCNTEQNYLLQAPGCIQDLSVIIGELTVNEDRQLVHNSLEIISCSDGEWLVNGTLITMDP